MAKLFVTRKLGLGMAIALQVFIAIGCTSDDHGPMQDLSADEQKKLKIEAITKNEHMPQQAKDDAIARINASYGTKSGP